MVLSLGLKLWVADVARCLSVNHSSCLHFFRKAKCSTKNPCFSRLFKRQVTQLWDDVSGGPLGASKGASCLGCRSDTAVAPGEAKSKRTRALLPTEAGRQKKSLGLRSITQTTLAALAAYSWTCLFLPVLEIQKPLSVNFFLLSSLLICTKCKHCQPLRQQWYILPSFSASLKIFFGI